MFFRPHFQVLAFFEVGLCEEVSCPRNSAISPRYEFLLAQVFDDVAIDVFCFFDLSHIYDGRTGEFGPDIPDVLVSDVL